MTAVAPRLVAMSAGFRPCILRAAAAGASFALLLTAGLTAMTAWECGGVCIPEIATNAALSFAAGTIGLGPLAAFGRRH